MRLPPTRDLARQHRLSRGTVINAFELLRAEGYVKGTVGSGTYVSKQIPEDFLQARADGRPVHDPQISPRLSEYSKRARFSLGNEARPVRAFRANIPAVDLFPTGVWARVVANRLRRASMSLLLGCEPFGYAALRIAIQDHLNAFRGMRYTAEQVVIVSGSGGARPRLATPCQPGRARCGREPGLSGGDQTVRFSWSDRCPDSGGCRRSYRRYGSTPKVPAGLPLRLLVLRTKSTADRVAREIDERVTI